MPSSSTSDTINALGIFGRLDSKQEEYFQGLQNKYSDFLNTEIKGVINHLSIVINNDVPSTQLSQYQDLLKKLKPFLPFKINILDVVAIDKNDLALSFDLSQTQVVRDLATKVFPDGVINTFYIKVIRAVPLEKQEEVKGILEEIKEIVIDNFILCESRVDSKSIISSSLDE